MEIWKFKDKNSKDGRKVVLFRRKICKFEKAIFYLINYNYELVNM